MERIRGEAQRMQRLIGRLLALARAESGQQILDYPPTDVTALLQSLTNRWRRRWRVMPSVWTFTRRPQFSSSPTQTA